MKVNCGGRRAGFPIDVVKVLGAGVGAIEFGLMDAEQFEFAGTRGGGVGATFEGDGFDLVNQASESAGDAIGVGVFVESEASAEVFGLPDVEDAVGLAAHNVNAGFARGGFEKVVAKAFDQGPRQGE
jgi:hypothetical protein